MKQRLNTAKVRIIIAAREISDELRVARKDIVGVIAPQSWVTTSLVALSELGHKC
jgi:hypothetical protein